MVGFEIYNDITGRTVISHVVACQAPAAVLVVDESQAASVAIENHVVAVQVVVAKGEGLVVG